MELLRHPLLILLIGAALSGWLIPTITRRWQDRQKEFELKNGLITEIIESITEIVMFRQYFRTAAIQYEAIRHFPAKEEVAKCEQDVVAQKEQLDKAYLKWEVKTAVIEAKLRIYFPRTGIPTRWNGIVKTILVLIQLAHLPEGSESYRWNEFWNHLPVKLSDKDFKDPDARVKWEYQRKAIALNQTALIDRIIQAKPTPLMRRTRLEELRDRARLSRSRSTTEKVKANTRKAGTGEAARVKVKLRDGGRLEGYISAADEECLTVTTSESGISTTVYFTHVKSLNHTHR
jgi:hypothetical protein